MAWNPGPEVAVARDAAAKLGGASMAVVVYVSADGRNLGYASYGKTVALCGRAKRLADALFAAATKDLAGGKP